VPDVATAPGPGAASNVKVFDGASGVMIRSFFAYDPTFTGGVNIALGDVNGDGKADIVTGADKGGSPHVKVFDGSNTQVIRSFLAYGQTFVGGVRVAAADVNGDGKADLITGAGPGGGPHVKVFDGSNTGLLASFFAYSPTFTGGVFVAGGDVTGDGLAEVLVSPGSGLPLVRAYVVPTLQLVRSFLAYDASFTGGVRIAAGNLAGDQRAEIVTGPAAGSALVKTFNPSGSFLSALVAYSPSPAAGVHVAVAAAKTPVRVLR
jgi:hypothetical protein